jgi:hypothetical protein
VTRSSLTAIVVFVPFLIAGCSDPSPTTRPGATAPAEHPTPAPARLRGTVDAVAGTLTFDPVPGGPSLAGGSPEAAIYGNQGQTVQIYNSPVIIGAPVGGKKTYTANVGVRNRLAYRIGDEQGAAVPADTLGIFVFVNTNPVVQATSPPCTTCAVTVRNRDGTQTFSAANQPYWYYHDVLSAFGGVRDTTSARRTWIFEADTQVTRFSFDVLVSAPWVAPNETVFKVNYKGDSLPDAQAEPRWKMVKTVQATEAMVAAGLQISLQRTKDSLLFVRYDSLSGGMNAMLEARFRLDDGGASTEPQPGIVFDDQTKFIGVFLADSSATDRGRAGFVNAAGLFIAGASDSIPVRSFHIYQLRKFGSDSALLFVDGARKVKVNYSALPASKIAPANIWFGFTNGVARTTITTWEYVTYQLGQATP